MVVRLKRERKPDDYAVGYKKPPKATQFKPGKSGNPIGRKTGSKNFKTELEEELLEKITIKESGKPKKIPKQRAMLKALMAKAIQGDVKAANVVLNMVLKLVPEAKVTELEENLSEADIDILNEFAESVLRSNGEREERS